LFSLTNACSFPIESSWLKRVDSKHFRMHLSKSFRADSRLVLHALVISHTADRDRVQPRPTQTDTVDSGVLIQCAVAGSDLERWCEGDRRIVDGPIFEGVSPLQGVGE
jgi:hypothetical protein